MYEHLFDEWFDAIIEGMPNGKDYVLFYLKLLCESVDHEGNLRFSEQIPYNEQMLSTITDTNVDIVRNAINIFTELGMMELMDDGTFYMNEVQKNASYGDYYSNNKKDCREDPAVLLFLCVRRRGGLSILVHVHDGDLDCVDDELRQRLTSPSGVLAPPLLRAFQRADGDGVEFFKVLLCVFLLCF